MSTRRDHVAAADARYLLDNRAGQAAQRFDSLAELFDAVTVGHLSEVGVGAGWRCLEVGAGGGSITSWLADRVGPTGSVLATDLDPRWLPSPDRPQLQIRRHDIVRDPLPDSAFDLIHERLVLIHLPERDAVLDRLVQTLRPGGWLIVEDFDNALAPDGELDLRRPGDERAAQLMSHYRRGFTALLSSRGAAADPLGRRLAGLLDRAGLINIAATGHLPIVHGSATADLHAANLTQVREQLIAADLMTAPDIDTLLDALTTATFTPAVPLLVSAWGQRPPATP